MSRAQSVILTNMCLIEDGQGNVVMQIRDPKRYRWSGYALPGGILSHTKVWLSLLFVKLRKKLV
mgnify:CR=1 FL=1